MPDTFGDWQVVARETNDRAGPIIAFLTRLLFLVPEPPRPSSVTWTVRHAQTGEVRKITAMSEKQFEERLAASIFD
jgi:hypothetical protein